MSLTKLFFCRRLIISGLLPFLLMLSIKSPSLAQGTSSEEAKGTNVKWATKADIIIINYDLIGSPDTKYEVRFILKKENDPLFVATPLTVEGDIGEGFFAGTNREARWYYRRDYPQGFQGEGYYFEIHVTTIAQPSNWVYYVIGAAAVTAGAVALLVSRNQETQSPPSELPLPPGRP